MVLRGGTPPRPAAPHAVGRLDAGGARGGALALLQAGGGGTQRRQQHQRAPTHRRGCLTEEEEGCVRGVMDVSSGVAGCASHRRHI